MTTLTDFLLARIEEEETEAREATPADEARTFYGHLGAGRDDWGLWYFNIAPARILIECDVKRQIIQWHQNWPVLVEGPPEMEPVDPSDVDSLVFRMSKRIAWLTEQEYRNRFGDEPPTSPILRLLALPYADHPDYEQEWRP